MSASVWQSPVRMVRWQESLLLFIQFLVDDNAAAVIISLE